jgi:Zn-dependent peptidase ImmA (M78 family)
MNKKEAYNLVISQKSLEAMFLLSSEFLSEIYDINSIERISISTTDSKFEFESLVNARRLNSKDGNRVLAFFDPNEFDIIINLELHDNNEELLLTMMHELVHAAKYALGHGDWFHEKETYTREREFKQWLKKREKAFA